MDPRICRDTLERLLAEEAATLSRLEELLDQEHEFLTSNDVEALEKAGEARQSCIAALIAIEDERRSLCRMMNVSADAAGLDKLLNWCDPSRQLKTRWAACAQRAAHCRSLNDRNGALVTARLKRVEGMLGVITGRASQPKVYGSKGAYETTGRSDRVIARV
ncbi:MAG TPA: flagellar protein FlgN [Povalibacter sp.]|uniref:flagella synthesis protein FlgN n=1 Tax=Povalibacter sp. TaxID=1962978 RepID=UPI002BC72494|nr:flagellar protein FlgN [Povalibacter sp.]HMN45266.1 flagellar protein FlgN [Povalibacter sp.]